MDSQNPYPKSKVINASKRALVAIEQDRENAKNRICSGHKQFRWFGRELTVNEVWERLDVWTRALINLPSQREDVINRILAAADKCIGDTINLTNRELEMIVEYWE